MQLSNLITPDRIVCFDGEDKAAALTRLLDALGAAPEVGDPAALAEAMHKREALMSTGIGLGIAVPHARTPRVQDLVLAVGVSKAGITYGSIDDGPVHVIVMVAAGAHQHEDYIQTLARVVLVLKNPKVREALMAAATAEAVYDVLSAY